MDATKAPPQIQDIVDEIDRLIAEMNVLRNQVSALGASPARLDRSVREAEYFGMWAEREDMRGRSSRERLESLRSQQWVRQ
jgi:prefoldin subunit 5